MFKACQQFATVKQRVWRSMCKSTHFRIYIRKPHVFLPLLATTGAASMAQMPWLFLEFLNLLCCFSLVRKVFPVFVEPFVFDTLLRRNKFDTLLRRKVLDEFTYVKHQTSKRQTSNAKRQTSNVKHQTSNDKRKTANVKCQTWNAKRQTANIKRQTPNVERQTPTVKR